MKLMKIKNWLMLFGLFSTMLALSACNDKEVAQLTGKSPVPQLDFGVPASDNTSDVIFCGCNTPPPQIATSIEITALATPKGQNKKFQVKVNKLSDCDMSSCSANNGDCHCVGRRYFLSFNNNYQIGDFESIVLKKHDGISGLEKFYMANGDGIYAKQPFIATFEWTAANNNNPIPTAAQLSDGGICIIGVLTDPNEPPALEPIEDEGNG